MKNLAIIPARGGSVRIPRKNIVQFHGKPLISYSIEIAKKFNDFDEIMVSTDDSEIAEIAGDYGAQVPILRSKKNSDHFATLADVVEEVISYYKSKGKIFQNICCILPSAPLITLSNLTKGYELLHTQNHYSIRPVVRFAYPIQRAFSLRDGKVNFINPENEKVRSQDLEPSFHDAGQFYWMYFEKGMTSTNRGGFEISEMEAQDIDTPEDLKIAELKYSLLKH